MPETTMPAPGQIGWIDFTVTDAGLVRAFCEHATRWTASPVAIGNHNDYRLVSTGSDKAIAAVAVAPYQR